MTPAPVLWTIWGVWLASWVAAARWSSAIAVSQSGGERLFQSVFILAGAILVLANSDSRVLFLHPLLPGTPSLPWTGVALAILGLAITWWARIHLARDWSASVTLKEDHRLVRSGPYAITRHPIYSGLLIAFVGTALVNEITPLALPGLALLTCGFVLKLRQEERFLADRFGEAYRDYRNRVPGLLPGIW